MCVFVLVARHYLGDFGALTPMRRVLHLAWLVLGAAASYVVVLLFAGLRLRHLREP
jgi:peptidoglycan biosynthesis protein MviN/MurJ (putative lipid II flippase)